MKKPILNNTKVPLFSLVKTVIFIFILVATLSCSTKEISQAAVVSARSEASKIGVAVMKKGGNAFDAMIATDLALAVCYPNAGNIAGGGFLVFRKADGTVGTLDYREKAPMLANRDLYLDEQNNVIPGKSTLGGLAVGVPGTVAGLYEIHQRFGTLPWKELVQPAIELAKKGYVVTAKQEKSFNTHRENFIKVNGKGTLYGSDFKEGDRVVNTALANSLEQIAAKGKDGFYSGSVADALVERVTATGGIISHDDLKAYSPVWRDAIKFDYKDITLYSMAPPSSGGVCLGQILKMIAPYPIDEYGHNSLKTMQVVVEAERRSYADRSQYLGDPDFVAVPVDDLLDDAYLRSRMETFSFDAATPSSEVGSGSLTWEESEETTHYSIVDPMGNAVAVTTTLNASYGSKVFVEEGGFFLNNEMDDFSSKPGVPNMFGLVGSEANAIAPQKRMLSSMTPTIVEKNGKLSMVVGTPGGSTIITSVLQTILNVYDFNMEMQAAVEAPRFHHQWLPDMVILEPQKFDSLLIQKLNEKGYQIMEKYSRIIGRVDAIHIDENNVLTTGADPRGDDTAILLNSLTNK